MGPASTLSLHERGQIKALSTTGYPLKRIADVVKRSRKDIMNFLRHQEEYGTKKSSGRSGKLNDREKGIFCALRRITRPAPLEPVGRAIDASESMAWRMLNKCSNIVRSRWEKCPHLIEGHKNERLRFARYSLRFDWGKVLVFEIRL
uniref:HTH_Tnp_Tc3_1 domain-containing protein n=1 Tax=Heterorhabditis bacteriophora TaxID=37862 RepID=A0A1I7WGF0_HETBA